MTQSSETITSDRIAPPAFHVMLKPRGAICNLDCSYCYYLSKELLYPGSRFRMAHDLLEEYTRQYIEAQQVPEVTFAWQGGEPTLMGLEFFQLAIELQQKYQRPGMRIQNTLQTNGTTLDDNWCAFFKKNNFLIGLSIDGPQAIHDTYRVDKGHKPTFERVIAGLRLLQKHGVEVNILTTVHAANARYPLEVYRFLRDEVKTTFIQFIPIVERSQTPDIAQKNSSDNNIPNSGKRGNKVLPMIQVEHAVTDRTITARQYGEFMNAIFDEWVRHDIGKIFVQMFDVALAAWYGTAPGLCVFEETCGTALAMEHTGDVYSCDHFVDPHYKLGNLKEHRLLDMVSSPQQRQFGLDKRNTLPRYCRECPVLFACHGGCPKDRIAITPDGEKGLNYLCEGYKAFFTHIDKPMRMMVQELKAQRSPANIMYLLAQEEAELQKKFAHTGRNDLCPCGSNRKFKKCHGA